MTKKPVIHEGVTSEGEVIDLETLLLARLDADGRELLNPTPIAPPIGYKPAPSLRDTIRDMIQSEHLARAYEGAETFEEADDFEIGDDFAEVPRSPFEVNFDPPRDAPAEPLAAPPAPPPAPPASPPAPPPAGADTPPTTS